MVQKGSGAPFDPGVATADETGTPANVLSMLEDGRKRMSATLLPEALGWLEHPAKAIRRRAADSLAAALASGDIDADSLRLSLGSPSREVRWGVAFALRASGGRDAALVEAWMQALGDEDGDVRWAAASIVIEAAREEESLQAILLVLAVSGGPAARKMALFCLGAAGLRDASPFVAALVDEDSFVRLAALTSLGRLGIRDDDVLAAIAAVGSGDSDPRVRRGAVAILERLRPGPGA
jgi:HEAT repeat protein